MTYRFIGSALRNLGNARDKASRPSNAQNYGGPSGRGLTRPSSPGEAEERVPPTRFGAQG